jgi:hypothetical protein
MLGKVYVLTEASSCEVLLDFENVEVFSDKDSAIKRLKDIHAQLVKDLGRLGDPVETRFIDDEEYVVHFYNANRLVVYSGIIREVEVQ